LLGVPVSLIATCGAVYLFNYSINNLTLLAPARADRAASRLDLQVEDGEKFGLAMIGRDERFVPAFIQSRKSNYAGLAGVFFKER
jgi:hypothetical protein